MLLKILSKMIGKKDKQKKEIKKPKEVTAKDIRELRKPQESDVQETQQLSQEKTPAITQKNQVPDRGHLYDIFDKVQEDIEKTSLSSAVKNNYSEKPKDDKSLKNFISAELKSVVSIMDKKLTETISTTKTLSKTNIEINKDILAVNKDALEIQKESLEEQKEAEYKSEHRYKQTLKKAVLKAKDLGNKGLGLAKSGVEKAKGGGGILGMIGKLLSAGYLIKKFWPLIKEKLWPFIKDKIFPFIKDNLKEVVLGLGLAKLFMDPIGSLKTLFKVGSGIFKGLSSIVLSLTKFTAKGLFKLIKGTAKLAWEGVKELGGMAKPFFNKMKEGAMVGINKTKDLALSGINKVKDLATSGLGVAKEKLTSFKDGMGKRFGALNDKFSGKFKGMSEKMSDIGNKVKGIGKKLVEKGIGASMKIGKGMGAVLKVLKPIAKIIPFLGLIVTVWELLETFFPNFTETIKDMFNIDKIKALGSDIWDKVTAGIGAISDWISDKMAGVIDVVRGMVAGLVANTYGKLPLIGKYANKLADFIRGKKVNVDDEEKAEKKAEFEDKVKAEGISRANNIASSLEDSGVIETNTFGKDEIKDFKALEKYNTRILQGFIDSDNYSEEDNKKIKNIIKKKKDIVEQNKKDSILAQEQSKLKEEQKKEEFNALPKEEQEKITNDKNIKLLVGMKNMEKVYTEQLERIKKSDSPNKDKAEAVYAKMLANIMEKIESTENKIEIYNTTNNTTVEKTGELKDSAKVTNVAAELNLNQFSNGGWTGDGKEDDIAGVVHKKEFVLNQEMLKDLGANETTLATPTGTPELVKKSKDTNEKVQVSKAFAANSTDLDSNEYTLDKDTLFAIEHAKNEEEKNTLIEKAAKGKGIGAKQSIIDMLNRGKPSSSVVTLNGFSVRLTNAQEEDYLKAADPSDPFGEKQDKIINSIINGSYKDEKYGKIKASKKTVKVADTKEPIGTPPKKTSFVKPKPKETGSIKSTKIQEMSEIPANDVGKQDKKPGKGGRKKGSKNKKKGSSAGKFKKLNRDVDRVFLHCSDSDYPQHDNVGTIREWHLARGWSDIGYHYMIHNDGKISKGRPEEKIPSAQGGNNTGTIAIVLHGKKENLFNSAQMNALKKFCLEIDQAYDHDITFHGHREVSTKSCPVFDYMSVLKLKNGKLGINKDADTIEPNDTDSSDSVPGKAISKSESGDSLGTTSSITGIAEMTGSGKTSTGETTSNDKGKKELSFADITKQLSGGFGDVSNSIFKDLGLDGLVNINKDGSIKVKGNSEQYDELSISDKIAKTKGKMGNSMKSIGLGSLDISKNILSSGTKDSIGKGFFKDIGAVGNDIFKDMGLSNLVNINKDGSIKVKGNSELKGERSVAEQLSDSKSSIGNSMKSIGLGAQGIGQNLLSSGTKGTLKEGFSKVKGFFSSNSGDKSDNTLGEIRETDGTANSIRSIAAANDTKTREIELKNKRAKPSPIDSITKNLASKTAEKKLAPEKKEEKSNTTIIASGPQAPMPQMTLGNTSFDDNMLSLVGGII